MERFIKGDVLVISFPFSDLQTIKKRPVLVLAQGDLGDIVVCQITSSIHSKNYIKIDKKSFETGSLPIKSYVRPDKIFTADQKLILRRAGRLNTETLKEVESCLRNTFSI